MFLSKTHDPCLVLVEPIKTRPDITEKLLTAWEVKNQIKQLNNSLTFLLVSAKNEVPKN